MCLAICFFTIRCILNFCVKLETFRFLLLLLYSFTVVSFNSACDALHIDSSSKRFEFCDWEILDFNIRFLFNCGEGFISSSISASLDTSLSESSLSQVFLGSKVIDLFLENVGLRYDCGFEINCSSVWTPMSRVSEVVVNCLVIGELSNNPDGLNTLTSL